jgi:hypothetical protein
MIQEAWAIMQAEPRWMAILGLALDLAGGVLVAAVAWMRVTAVVYYGGPATEPAGPLWWRRGFVVLGGFLLAAGFALQMWATYRQIE